MYFPFFSKVLSLPSLAIIIWYWGSNASHMSFTIYIQSSSTVQILLHSLHLQRSQLHSTCSFSKGTHSIPVSSVSRILGQTIASSERFDSYLVFRMYQSSPHADNKCLREGCTRRQRRPIWKQFLYWRACQQ